MGHRVVCFSAEDKIRIVLDGVRGQHSIAELCRREEITQGVYYTWSKEFLQAGWRHLVIDTARAATSAEHEDLRQEALALKEVIAEQALDFACLKKHNRLKTWPDHPAAMRKIKHNAIPQGNRISKQGRAIH